jgi:hypothetical protein
MLVMEGLAEGEFRLTPYAEGGTVRGATVRARLPSKEVQVLRVSSIAERARALRIEVRAAIPELIDAIGAAAELYSRRRGEPGWAQIEISRGLWRVPNWPANATQVAVGFGEWRGTAEVTMGPDGGDAVARLYLDAYVPIRGTLVDAEGRAVDGYRIAVEHGDAPWSVATVSAGRFEVWQLATERKRLHVSTPTGEMVMMANPPTTAPCRIQLPTGG